MCSWLFIVAKSISNNKILVSFKEFQERWERNSTLVLKLIDCLVELNFRCFIIIFKLFTHWFYRFPTGIMITIYSSNIITQRCRWSIPMFINIFTTHLSKWLNLSLCHKTLVDYAWLPNQLSFTKDSLIKIL